MQILESVQVNGQGASFGLHFLANSLVWLSLSDSRNVTQLALLQELCSLPKTHAVSTLSKSCLTMCMMHPSC